MITIDMIFVIQICTVIILLVHTLMFKENKIPKEKEPKIQFKKLKRISKNSVENFNDEEKRDREILEQIANYSGTAGKVR